MPVSGLPMNAALLKTTSGSSGQVRKGFQNSSKAAGTVSPPVEGPAADALWILIRAAIVMRERTSAMERAMTPTWGPDWGSFPEFSAVVCWVVPFPLDLEAAAVR